MLENQSSLIEKFWNFNEDHQLSSSATLIYLFLLKEVFNRNTLRFIISDVYLSKQLGITRKTVKTNKEILESKGLIKLEIKNGVGCYYELVVDYQSQNNIEKIFDKEVSLKLSYERNTESSEKDKKLIIKGQNKKSHVIEKDDLPKKIETVSNEQNFPLLEEFLEFAKNLDLYKESIEKSVIQKYHEWLNNEWKNKFDRPITNWKSTLKNVLPYLDEDMQASIVTLQNIPDIRRINLEDYK